MGENNLNNKEDSRMPVNTATPSVNIKRGGRRRKLFIVTGIILVPVFVFVGLNRWNLAYNKNTVGAEHGAAVGKAKTSVPHRNISFAASAEIKGVNVEAALIDVFVESGSFTALEIKQKDTSLQVNSDAKIIVPGKPEATLADVAAYPRAYIFGKNIDGVFTVSKIIVPEELQLKIEPQPESEAPSSTGEEIQPQ